ncbi:hypothetical protein [Streptomyces aculeolatus]|nr:hypothetical protein [Streptomyces aculeolatus]
MTAFLVLAVWFAASLLAAAGYVALRRAARRPHDHQNPGGTR